MIKNKIFLASILVVSAFLMSGCIGLKDLKVGDIRGFNLRGIHGSQLDVEITLPVENPNAFKVKLKDADLTVTAGETLIGTIKQMDDVSIPGRSSKDYPIHVKVDLSNFKDNLFAIYGLIRSKPGLRLSGTIKVRAFPYWGAIKIKDYQLVN
jgi:LEA14-like dessication related protein